MAHNTFENDSETANNQQYVASVKRQKAIRRYIKLFFRVAVMVQANNKKISFACRNFNL